MSRFYFFSISKPSLFVLLENYILYLANRVSWLYLICLLSSMKAKIQSLAFIFSSRLARYLSFVQGKDVCCVGILHLAVEVWNYAFN